MLFEFDIDFYEKSIGQIIKHCVISCTNRAGTLPVKTGKNWQIHVNFSIFINTRKLPVKIGN